MVWDFFCDNMKIMKTYPGYMYIFIYARKTGRDVYVEMHLLYMIYSAYVNLPALSGVDFPCETLRCYSATNR